MEPRKPRVGLLALTLELYERLAPALRPGREQWVRNAVLPALEPAADVVFGGAAFRRADVDARVAEIEAAGCDALLVVLLTYSPSQIALPALRATHLPIVVWNTQELFAVDDAFTDDLMVANHGVHGTQDLCNVLLRSDVPFEYVTSHLSDPHGLDELVDFFAAAQAVAVLRRARLGILGYPFPGMGDFALDTTHMAATLGCEWLSMPMEEYIKRAADASPEAVSALTAGYRQSYELADGVTDADLEGAARTEAALRGMVADRRLDAFTYQFLAFGEDERTPTVPFVAASRLMAEGVGFGGEGDLIAAAGTAFLNRLQPPASFTEVFTIDFGGSSLFLSHMGEANVAMARTDRPVRLEARGRKITETRGRQLALVTTFRPGPATFLALTLGPESCWRIICSPVEVRDWGPLPGFHVPHTRVAPAGDVRDFLTAYARAGGPHHAGLCFGDARRRLRMAADMLDADYCEV